MPAPVRPRDALILRVLVDAPLDAQRDYAWALVDGAGSAVENGCGVMASWPQADRREAVLGADAVRMVALSLPAMPRDRLLAAATFALEERLASAPEDALVAIREADENGRVLAVVTSRELGRSLRDAMPAFSRAVAEPELAPTADGWRWCEDGDRAFVRTDDGGAFAVSTSAPSALPAELTLALAHAVREQRAPAKVVVDRPADAAVLQQWTEESGTRFVPGTRWVWHAQPSAVHRSATDVLRALDETSVRTATRARPMIALAATIVAAAIVLHALAGIGTWLWQRVELARAERELVAIARAAGAQNVDGASAASAVATLHAAASHRAGRAAPIDAMPVLARAAPALASLPSGMLRTATWSGGAWTLELGALDDAGLEGLATHMRSAGLAPLHARTTNGVRLRVTPGP